MKEYAELNKVSDAPALDGEKSNVTELIDKKLKVLAWKQINDRFSAVEGAMVTIIQCEHDGKKKVFFTRSKVLLEQLKKLNNDLPFAATVTKPEGKKYLTFK